MLQKNEIDIWSIDFRTLSPREREELRAAALRRAHAERAAMMDAVFMALPRLIGRTFRRIRRRRHHPVTIPRSQILEI